MEGAVLLASNPRVNLWLANTSSGLALLMAVGLMMLPAAAARLWATTLPGLASLAAAIAFASGAIGLDSSYHLGIASGPAIILAASLFYIFSIIAGQGGMVRRHLPLPHLTG
jgi:zinc/manganese transport system permease protein